MQTSRLYFTYKLQPITPLKIFLPGPAQNFKRINPTHYFASSISTAKNTTNTNERGEKKKRRSTIKTKAAKRKKKKSPASIVTRELEGEGEFEGCLTDFEARLC
jgi:hypothetical protein